MACGWNWLVWVLAALVCAGGTAAATPLDAVSCDSAKLEQTALTDVPAIMERGPQWAKDNVPATSLARVQRWIELEEILSFRCGRGRVTAEAQRAAAAAELIENPPPPPAETPPQKDAAGAAVAAPLAPATPAEAAPAPAPKPKPKPKPKPVAVPAGNTGPAASPPPDAAPAGEAPAAAPKKRAAKPRPQPKPAEEAQ